MCVADDPVIEIPSVSTARVATEEEVYVKPLNSGQTLKLSCSKPVQLDSILNEIQLMVSLNDLKWHLVYAVDGEPQVKIETQEDFEKYLATPCKPPLVIEVATVITKPLESLKDL